MAAHGPSPDVEEDKFPPHPASEPKLADAFGNQAGFYHGVASGDPLADAVIIWTRYTPMNRDDEISIEYRVAEVTPGASKFSRSALCQ